MIYNPYVKSWTKKKPKQVTMSLGDNGNSVITEVIPEDSNYEDTIIEDLITTPIKDNPDTKPGKIPSITLTFNNTPEGKFNYAYSLSGIDSSRLPFFSKLAKMESGYNPTIQNSAGYPAGGYFQFMDGVYTDKGGKTRSGSNIRDIANVDVSEFLNNPILQIQSANKLADKFLSNFSDEDKKKAKELGYSDSALVAGAWLAGPGGVKKFLHKGQNSSDVHGTNVKHRMDEFNNYFKDGGVLRLQEGGVNDARKGYENWIQRRADLYNSNLHEYSVFSFGSLGKNLALKNLDLAKVNINPSMVPEGANGVFRPAFRTISLVDSNPYTAVHEFAHSTLPKAQVYKIDKIKDIHSNSLYLNKNTQEDSYLDSSEEIYSRYMSLRYFLEKAGYDMNKKFTADDIEKILDTYTRSKTLNTDKGKFIKDNTGKVKNSITESFSIEDTSVDRDLDYRIKDTLGRYDLDFSAKVLSDVASNTKTLPQFIKGGAKIRKFDKGTSKATFDWVSNINGKVKDAQKKGLSYPEFWVNLRDGNRPWSIDEHGNPYTHKMAGGEYDGNYIVYPEAQVNNGILTDYSKYRDLALERAISEGEYVIAPSAAIAEEFTREYKNLPWFNDFDYSYEESRAPYRRAGSYQKGIKYGIWDSPFIKDIEMPKQVISNEWVPDESFVPTIEDLAKQFTMSYEDFRDKPYLLETRRADGSIQKQWLIGYGIADKDVINKYRANGIPKEVAQKGVIDELTGLHKSLGAAEPNYHKLPWNLQLAILDAAYNTNGASFWSVSKNLANLVRNGESDLSKFVSELDHSKTVRGWLGDRSAARRALALGKYRWNGKYIDEKGRHYNPAIPLDNKDWNRGLYIYNF